MTEKQLNELLAIFLSRTQSVVEEYLIRMGEQIQEIGELIPSEINRLVQLQRMNANLDAIKKEIARLAEISAEDLMRIFEAAMESDARFVASTFGNEFKPSILQKPELQRMLQAQLRVTIGEMANLSQTTIASEAYRKAIDKGIQAVQMGLEDYNKAIRRALREAAETGIMVEIPGTGVYEKRAGYAGRYSRRLDSAVRQNVLDGIRSLSNSVMEQLGEEFGADGWEISAHALCAEDHLPYQGRQYSIAEFERIQNRLKRKFFTWNCKHSKHPILLGISEPAYSNEELESYRRNSMEKIEIDGRTQTRYQWTQEQRRTETAIRRQKDVGIAAKAAGDNALRRDSQRKINALMDHYRKISEGAGIKPDYTRTRVEGFKELGKRELKKLANSDKLESIRETIRTDSVVKTINADKQNRHIRTSEKYIAGRSYIYGDVDTAQSLVNTYHGTGKPVLSRKGIWTNKEVVMADKDIGVNIDVDTGVEESTDRFVIHYSKTGTHIVPCGKEKKGQ